MCSNKGIQIYCNNRMTTMTNVHNNIALQSHGIAAIPKTSNVDYYKAIDGFV